MNNYFKPIPFGCALPLDNPHAVSVSFPVLQDVIDYEEGKEEALAQMQSGYPRFFQNKLVEKLVHYIRNIYNIPLHKVLLPIASIHAKSILEYLTDETFYFIEHDENVFLLLEEDGELGKKCKDYIRNTGLLISSRKAEATLFKYNQIDAIFEEEEVTRHQAKENIHTVLADAYGVGRDAVLLTNSGMNAMFAAYQTITAFRKQEGRENVVQLGWLYVDTMEIIEKRSGSCYFQMNINDKEQLEDWLQDNHLQVAVIITEVTTNPLMQCVDLPWLSVLCKKYAIVLLIDVTIATPFNVDVLAYCDIAVESLTKFASGGGDILMGAIILNQQSTLIQNYTAQFHQWIIPPFESELCRLGFQIINYEQRVARVAQNTEMLYHYLSEQSFIKEIHSVFHPSGVEAYSKIRKSETAVPGIISVVFDEALAFYYDHLEMAKGPTLGTTFTIAMPYVYLAHYNNLQSQEGIAALKNLGLDPGLLRISIGIEPIETLIAVFENLKNRIAVIKTNKNLVNSK